MDASRARAIVRVATRAAIACDHENANLPIKVALTPPGPSCAWVTLEFYRAMADADDPFYFGPERRRDKRRALTLAGRAFCAKKGENVRCMLIDISPGGAAISCPRGFEVSDALVLHLEELGRFDGVVVSVSGSRVSIQFEQTERARKRAMEKIALYRHGRLVEITNPDAVRSACGAVMNKFTWSDGHVSDCEIADISLSAASLRTRERPPLNEVIRIGLSAARVVRYEKEGIGVEFLSRQVYAR